MTKPPERERITLTGILTEHFLGSYANGKLEGGLSVLRGYAKASDLIKVSKADENYQRHADKKHIEGIKNFLLNGRELTKYIPEVVLMARGREHSVSPFTTNSTSMPLPSIPAYFLTAKKTIKIDDKSDVTIATYTTYTEALYRIDGNHRLLALNDDDIKNTKKDFLIPFAIIQGSDSDYYINQAQENEAFLFYFLNSKNKPLTTEENFKALLNTKEWRTDELKEANPHLPVLKNIKQEFIDTEKLDTSLFKNKKPYTELHNFLNLLDEEKQKIFEKEYKKIIEETIELYKQRSGIQHLKDKFKDTLIPIIMYAIIKFIDSKEEPSTEDAKKTITTYTIPNNIFDKLKSLNTWLKNKKYNASYFVNFIALVDEFERHFLNKKYNIFVAMPYYGDDTIKNINQEFETVQKNLNKKQGISINIYPIMYNKVEAKDIKANIIEEIENCNIFIADISFHKNKQTNPNVMYELGIAKGLKKKIIIFTKEEIKKSPFDISTDFMHEYKEIVDLREQAQKCIEKLIEEDLKE